MKGYRNILSLVALIFICAAFIAGVTACGKKAAPQPLDEATALHWLVKR